MFQRPHPVTIVAFPGVQALDVVGPFEVFAAASQHEHARHRADPYLLRLVSAVPGRVRTESGLCLHADPLPGRPGDGTLLIPGGPGARQMPDGDPLLAWLTGLSPERLATVCTGTFPAAQASLVTDHRVTTHWAYCGELAARYPRLRVEQDPVYLRDRQVWSSAGVTAGIDLALALVATDIGASAAQAIARWLVMFLHRPGSQSQFAAPVWLRRARDPLLRAVQHRIDSEPGADHRIEVLAQRAGMSPRHFQRRFAQQVGVSAGAYVSRVRLETARRMLTQTREPIATVARRAGFGTAETLRRALAAGCGVTPSDYRDRFTITTQPGGHHD